MRRLIFNPVWDWFRHQKNSVNCGFKRLYRRKVADNMPDDHLVKQNGICRPFGDLPRGSQCELPDTVEKTEEGDALKIEKG
jgi:hypothetical protein